MGILEAVILGIVLSLDAFAASLSIGVCFCSNHSFHKIRFLLIIGIFHFLMPILGWSLAGSVHSIVAAYDHWVAFVLLSYLGGKMILEGVASDEKQRVFSCSTLRSAIMFGLALSIDAIIAGFSLGMTKIDIVNLSQLTNILIVSAIIGLSAFLITLLGINIGGMVGKKLGGKAEIFGGLVLIILGLKTLLTHILI